MHSGIVKDVFVLNCPLENLKYIYRRVVYPSPLVLNGVVLPWRESAVHLDHSLQANLYFSAEAGVRRAAFISRSVEVWSQCAFAQSAQILTAVKTLCCYAYGSVLWRLDSPYSSSFYSAYTSWVRGFTSCQITPIPTWLMATYPRGWCP